MEIYDPCEAMKQHLEKEQRQNETDKLQEAFDEINEKEYEEARYKKPSQEIMAYYSAYRHYPKGHPLATD